eukprot:GEMP01036505.1.p1 GENE.GEMP01036505.1~~GEMP01036505.1.p1  ORF type:complete len:369 (+),score=65.72 GEMP01036505.1:64-1170(+)
MVGTVQRETPATTDIDTKIAVDDWTDVPHAERRKRDRILTDDELAPLLVKSDARALAHVAGHLAVVYCTGALVLQCSWWILPFAWLCHGFVLQCLAYAGQHETLHYTAFKTKRLNEVVSFFASVPCFEFAAHERVLHKQHHIFPQDPKRDPELSSSWSHIAHIPGFAKVPDTQRHYWREFYDIPGIMRSHVLRFLNCARGCPVDYGGERWSLAISTESVRTHLQMHAIYQILAYMLVVPLAVTTWGLWIVLKVWLIPVLLGFMPITFVRIGEHSHCTSDFNGLTNTRSCETFWPIQFLMWNMNFHADHHLYTSVPFYHLPQLHVHLRGKLQNVDAGFVGQNRIMYSKWIPEQMACVRDYLRDNARKNK